jgi:hypothetical protein
MAARLREMNLAQRWSLGIGIYFLVMGTIGLAVNPDFATGSDATAEQWGFVDWNGWHAVATYLVAAPLLVGAFVRWAAVPMVLYVGAANVFTAVWGIFDSTPVGLIRFQHRATDIVLHLTVAAILLTVGFVQLRRDRSARAAPVAV